MSACAVAARMAAMFILAMAIAHLSTRTAVLVFDKNEDPPAGSDGARTGVDVLLRVLVETADGAWRWATKVYTCACSPEAA